MRDWSIQKLNIVSKIVNGGTPKTNVSDYWDGDINWITPKDLGQLETIYTSDTPRTITELGLKKSSAKEIPSNSVILSTRAPIGHLAINTVPMAFNQGCRGIVPCENLDTKYLYYFLYKSIELLNKLGTGATFKELSARALKGIEIPIPPLPEQKRIVAILDEAFEAIDKAKANIERNIQNAEELFQSKLNEVFTQRGEGWEEKRLDEVCENLDSMRKPVTKKDREEGPYPYYGASGIVDYVADFIFDEDLLLVSEDGANLLARTYPIAFSISGKNWVNNHAHVLRFDNFASQRFIEYYLNSIKLDPWVSGMAQPKLNQRNLNSIPVPFPSIADQEIIVNLLDLLKNDIESLTSAYKNKIKGLEELKKSILQKAFSGELTANEHVAA